MHGRVRFQRLAMTGDVITKVITSSAIQNNPRLSVCFASPLYQDICGGTQKNVIERGFDSLASTLFSVTFIG
jgi:hypothetical protein